MAKPGIESKKKILVISPVPTHPPYSGNSKCTLSYCEMLMEAGYDISFLWVADRIATSEQAELTRRFWKDRLTVYRYNLLHRLMIAFYRRVRFRIRGNFHVDDLYPFGLGRVVGKILDKNYDCIIINYVFLSKAFRFAREQKKVLYTHDVFTDRYRLTGNPWFSVSAGEEAKALDRADVILSIQEDEAAHYRSITGRKVLTTYSNFRISETPYVGQQVLLFLGGSNMHNVEAVTLFVDEVFQPLIEKHPDMKLLIGGSVCKVLGASFGGESIEILGEVSDLFQFYSLGDVVINPTVSGTGLKIKTFEAMSYGKVIVAHPHNTIGIYKKDEAPILEASSPEDYIRHITRIFEDKNAMISLKKESVNYIRELNEIVRSRFTMAIEE